MLHRLSEAFNEVVADLGDPAHPKKEKAESLQTGSLSGFARFSKEIHEGWQNVSPNQFGFPNAPLDPKTQTGQKTAKGLGGVEEIKGHYDAMLRAAKDDTKLNNIRSNEVKQVYGIDIPNPASPSIQGPSQVYAVGNAYIYTRDDANKICAKYGGRVATSAELEVAQKFGANWCYSGWVREGMGKWPITTHPIGGCGGRQGIIEWTPYAPQYGWHGDRAGINCYGPKPRPDEKTAEYIWPFNDTLWDQPTEKSYITVPSGYLEASSSQPACFYGLSPEQAKKGCDRLGSQCVGFSYSKDGAGHGCFKGDHAGGLNTNAAYMGYAKVPVDDPSPVDGRYIRLDYPRYGCLNLAQILVYSSEGGPNLITPSTKVTKPSGWNGDQFPSSNFVNQNGNQWWNFVHTSCADADPWIEVDLGSVVRIYKVVVWNRQDCCQYRIVGTRLSILDQEREKVYVSNPISTTNQSYTWMPPNGNVLVDKDPIRSQKPFRPTNWTCLGGIPSPMRRNNNGEIECMSYNAKDCLWGNNNTCNNLLANANWGAIRPLICGADHARKWGGPGSNDPGHWCYRVDQML